MTYIERIHFQKKLTFEKINLNDSIDKPDGVYITYFKSTMGLYLKVIDNKAHLYWEKCWEPVWWVRFFGRFEAEWDYNTVDLYATVIIKNNLVTFVRYH